ncbi:MAG: glyoxylate/hydroxypyruvate reductase A [Propionivibrio sp.]
MLYLYTPDQPERYLRLLQDALPGEAIACWPQELDATAVTHAAVWAPPSGFFSRFPNLRTVFVMGAGVDKLLQRNEVPQDVALVRLTDAGMAQQMTEYCLIGLLHYQRQMDRYARQQRDRLWKPLDTRLARDVRVGLLGLGELGGRVAQDLVRLGYRVSGWSRRPRQVENVRCEHGDDGLRALLPQTDVLFCVLPSTPETRHLLDAETLALLPDDAALINAGRGSLIDEAALLARLDAGRLRFALLDVFAEEPLPESHPFWTHPRVIITPHVAADTVPEDAARQIAANLRAQAAGRPMTGVVDRRRGY